MIKFLDRPSPNFYDLSEPAYIVVLHTTLGSYEGALNWLTSKRSQASAHLLFGRHNRVAQLVSFNKGAWHSGRINRPSARARKVCRKDIFGRIKNPNKYTFGFEVASGWDIDKDGLVEAWEKLYSTGQVTNIAKAILKLEIQKRIKLSDSHILTHRDFAIDKPNLELMRIMVLAELRKLRKGLISDIIPKSELKQDREEMKKEIIKLVGQL